MSSRGKRKQLEIRFAGRIRAARLEGDIRKNIRYEGRNRAEAGPGWISLIRKWDTGRVAVPVAGSTAPHGPCQPIHVKRLPRMSRERAWVTLFVYVRVRPQYGGV